jgi:chitosanase
MNNTIGYLAFIFLSLLNTFCSKETNVQTSTLPFNAEQRKIADQIISFFENDDPVLRYDYIENLRDGRGYTAGRAGFTSATCDMLEVINRYATQSANNALVRYIPRLKELCNTESASISGLEGLPEAWVQASKDPLFKSTQDKVVDDFYYQPAIRYTQSLGLKYPLSLLNLYDACIQHGDGEDPDGLKAMITKTSKAVNGTPSSGIKEEIWLSKFMDIRRATLLNPSNKDTQQVWAESVGRVDALKKLFQTQQYNLKKPVKLEVWGNTHSLPQ